MTEHICTCDRAPNGEISKLSEDCPTYEHRNSARQLKARRAELEPAAESSFQVPQFAIDLYERFVPVKTQRTIRKYAKSVVASIGGILIVVNALAPALSGTARDIAFVVIALGTALGVRQVPNKATPAR